MAIEHEEICWRDFGDYCHTQWHDLYLEAKKKVNWDWLGPDVVIWCWAIRCIKTNVILDSVFDHPNYPSTGEEARKCAEAAARYWGERKGYNRHSLVELHVKGHLNALKKRRKWKLLESDKYILRRS
jgi:hypothetical protein